ncbi:hypothetical protein BC834DRAFT_851306 [Gloeopeniophorella convolvens]|nr:hypothetical protein BC834DRAFT_851306 [Gloeopeniophorella convolvens]
MNGLLEPPLRLIACGAWLLMRAGPCAHGFSVRTHKVFNVRSNNGRADGALHFRWVWDSYGT